MSLIMALLLVKELLSRIIDSISHLKIQVTSKINMGCWVLWEYLFEIILGIVGKK